MSYTVIVILSLSIVIPAIIALIRFNKIDESYHPFIYCIWLGLLNEIVSLIVLQAKHNNVININIYLLFESLLLAWQFRNWQLFKKHQTWFRIIIASFVAGWLVDNIFISKMTSFNSYFRIMYSSFITFMSISIMNYLIVTERRSLLKNSTFILTAAFVIYYTINILSELFWLYGINESKTFRISVYNISVITNFITILLYSISILWMPIKHRFTLPSS